ncbi:PocR domain-containing protein, partial [Dysosmobacter welbionis]
MSYQLRSRLIAGKDKHAEGFAVRCVVLGHPPGFGIPVPEIAERSVAGHLLHLCVGEDGDLLVAPGRVRCGLGAGEVVPPDENGHLTGVLGKEHALLRRSKAAAHHKYILPGEELSVAGGAVGHAPASKLFLPLEAHHAGMGAGGQQDAETLQISPAGADGLYIAGEFQPSDLGQQKLSAEALRLLPHGLGKLRPAGPAHAGIIHHFRGNGDLPAEVVLLHDHDPVAGT